MNIDEWLEAWSKIEGFETVDGWYSAKEIRIKSGMSRYKTDRMLTALSDAGLLDTKDGYRLNRAKKRQCKPVYRLKESGDGNENT